MYNMRMTRVNVYLPDDLAGAAKAAGLKVSNLTQDAIRGALVVARTDAWLDRVFGHAPSGVDHDEILAVLPRAAVEKQQLG
jgi:post-segregation antitoxin (ccd killing protein)